MASTIRCIVRGQVQGVFFRASTRTVASRLGIIGHAINLPDGSVEVLAQGDEASLEQLKRFLREGPEHARVNSLDCELFEEFEIPGSQFTTG